MAHELEITAKGAAFAYAEKHGETWHRLGVPVRDDMTPQEIAQAAQIDWMLEMSPIETSDLHMPIDGFYALRRETDKRVYDIVTSLYKPLQPMQAISFFEKWVKIAGLKMETCGSLQDGRRIFATARLPEGFTLAGGDRVEGFLLFNSPNYAGEAAYAKFTSTRVVCANTLRMAMSDGRDSVRINHVTEFNDAAKKRVEEALGLALDATHQFQAKAERLALAPATDEQILEYVFRVSKSESEDDEIDVIAELEKAAAQDKKPVDISVDSLNRVGKKILNAVYHSPGSDLRSAQNTYWGAVNGVSYVVDHEGNKDIGKRYESAWFGAKAKLKNEALNLALQMAGVN